MKNILNISIFTSECLKNEVLNTVKNNYIPKTLATQMAAKASIFEVTNETRGKETTLAVMITLSEDCQNVARICEQLYEEITMLLSTITRNPEELIYLPSLLQEL